MTKLQRIRKDRGLTQKELSQKSGIALRSIQHYERGEFNFANVGINVMLRFALALECRLSDLLDEQAAETALAWEQTVLGG